MTTIIVERFSEGHLEDFLELSKSEYGPSISTNACHIRWKHLHSPFGPSYVVNLLERDLVVGRALVQPRPLRIKSEMVNVASVMDMLVECKHRTSPANFIKITKATGSIEKFSLVFHTANEKTHALYSKLLRFSNPFSLKAYGFPVRVSGIFFKLTGLKFIALDLMIIPFNWLLSYITYLISFISGLDVSDEKITDEELENLCVKSVHQSEPHLVRSNAFLKWRFEDTEVWAGRLFRVDINGKFCGYIVTKKMELGGVSSFVLMDFILDPSMSFISTIALRFWLVCEAFNAGTDLFFTMVNPLGATALKFIGFPFVHIADRLLPHATPIFMRSRNDNYKYLEQDISIHMTLADLDYF